MPARYLAGATAQSVACQRADWLWAALGCMTVERSRLAEMAAAARVRSDGPLTDSDASPLRWKAVLDAAVEQSRARISNNPGGRGPAIGRGPVGERRATAPPSQQADPGENDSSLPPPPLFTATPCRECSAAGDAATATAMVESGAAVGGGVDAAALHVLMQQMSVGVSSLNARLGAIESRIDGRAQQEQGSDGGGCCEVSASGSDAGQPPARAPPEV